MNDGIQNICRRRWRNSVVYSLGFLCKMLPHKFDFAGGAGFVQSESLNGKYSPVSLYECTRCGSWYHENEETGETGHVYAR